MLRKTIIIVLIVSFFFYSVGCYTFSRIEKDELTEIEKNDVIRIKTIENKVYHLIDVEIEGSFLKGYKYEKRYKQDRQRWENEKVGDQILMPDDSIKEIEVDKINPFLSIALIIGIPGAIILIVMAAWAAD